MSRGLGTKCSSSNLLSAVPASHHIYHLHIGICIYGNSSPSTIIDCFGVMASYDDGLSRRRDEHGDDLKHFSLSALRSLT